MKKYNKKGFLVPDSIRTMAAYHAKIMDTGEYMFRIHDCNGGIRLRGDVFDRDQAVEAVEKFRALSSASERFADFIDHFYVASRNTELKKDDAATDIIADIANVFGYTFAEITARDRIKDRIDIRSLIYMKLLDSGRGYSQIGRMFGKNHATIMYAIKRLKELIDIKDPETMRNLKKLESHEK